MKTPESNEPYPRPIWIALGSASVAFLAMITCADAISGRRVSDSLVRAASTPALSVEPVSPLDLEGLDINFIRQMDMEGFTIQRAQVLGNKRKIASAGEGGNFVTAVPLADEKRFPPYSALNWGDCFVWDGKEVAALNRKNGIVDLFTVSPGGYIRLHRAWPGGVTDWFVYMDDPKCEALPDGSISYGKGVFGPSLADQNHFNNLKW